MAGRVPDDGDLSPNIATRDALLDCAEQLIAERGVHGVSMREIGLAAGQRNNGATQYHFGTKDALVKAVFERRAREVDARRRELLDRLADERNATIHELVQAYVTPLAEHVGRRTPYVPFLSRLQAEHSRDALLQDVPGVNEVYARIRDGIRRAGPELATKRFAIRWRIAINLA